MLKHLNLDEMIGISAPWVNDDTRRPLFLSISQIAALHPLVVAVHAELLSAQPAGEKISPELQQIITRADAVDAVHDPLARAVSSGIEADRHNCFSAKTPDPERARRGAAVQSKLFPNGMNIINASFLAESGNTARVAQLLQDEPEIGAYLATIPVYDHTTLLDTTQRWIAAGAELGALERAREEQEAREATKPLGKAKMNALRARWIRIVSAVLSNLELSSAEAQSLELIRGPVLKASERAGKRYEGALNSPDRPTEASSSTSLSSEPQTAR